MIEHAEAGARDQGSVAVAVAALEEHVSRLEHMADGLVTALVDVLTPRKEPPGESPVPLRSTGDAPLTEALDRLRYRVEEAADVLADARSRVAL